MKSTLYEILEVSENASEEVIEKAYKVLAKRYHPDLQPSDKKQMAEQKMQKINEAYDILSDDLKRKTYDEKLKAQREIERQSMQPDVRSQETNTMNDTHQNQGQKTENAYYGKSTSTEEQKYQQMQREKYEEQLRKQQEKMQKNMQEQYENAYYDYLRSLGYRIKEEWSWEKTKKLILVLSIMIGILLILWIFPPTHTIMLNIYEGNTIIKVIVDIILGIIGAVFEAIGSGFKSLFNGW